MNKMNTLAAECDLHVKTLQSSQLSCNYAIDPHIYKKWYAVIKSDIPFRHIIKRRNIILSGIEARAVPGISKTAW